MGGDVGAWEGRREERERERRKGEGLRGVGLCMKMSRDVEYLGTMILPNGQEHALHQ